VTATTRWFVLALAVATGACGKKPDPEPDLTPNVVVAPPTGPEVAPAPRPVTRTDAGWKPLFDGKSLDGWKPDNKVTTWTVAAGMLVARGGTGSLFTARDDFADFALRVEMRCALDVDSGVFVRCNPKRFQASGFYEVNINTSPKPTERYFTGTVFVVPPGGGTFEIGTRVATNPIKPDEFFTLEVVAKGNTLTMSVDGKKVSEYTDPKSRYAKGAIGIQHAKDHSFEIRKIEIREEK
jgi:hypothetical protein